MKWLIKRLPVRVTAPFALLALFMVAWAPLIIAICEAWQQDRFRYEIRREWKRWLDAVRCVCAAFISGRPQ